MSGYCNPARASGVEMDVTSRRMRSGAHSNACFSFSLFLFLSRAVVSVVHTTLSLHHGKSGISGTFWFQNHLGLGLLNVFFPSLIESSLRLAMARWHSLRKSAASVIVAK